MCSTHVFQAAFPRESAPPGPAARSATSTPAEMSKAERQALAETRFNEITQLRRDIAFRSEKFPMNDVTIWSVANRYAPEKPRVGASTAVTVVLFHATGFHKEMSSFGPLEILTKCVADLGDHTKVFVVNFPRTGGAQTKSGPGRSQPGR
ncbi:hypothetical protein B0J17DRAFT_435377 [Rhizoctonia solani]|nr:hypothetical protein B0J17DRAFT_435377 [Rhizoctonia solani]